MLQEYGYKNKIGRIRVLLFAALFITGHFLIFFLNMMGKTMILGDVALSGVITAVQFVLALAMTVSDFDFGGNVATIMLLFSIMSNLIIMVKSHSLSPLPGLIYYIGSVAAVNVIRMGISKGRQVFGQEFLGMLEAHENLEMTVKGTEQQLLSDEYVELVENSIEVYGVNLKNIKFYIVAGEDEEPMDMLKKKKAVERLEKVGIQVELRD